MPKAAWGDRVAAVAVWTAAGLVTAVFAWLASDLVVNGFGQLSWSFVTEATRDAGRAGGIGPIIASTSMIIAICLAVAVPISLGTAILLAELSAGDSAFGRLVRRSLDVLAGVPSIVFGLFGNVFFCQVLGLGFSILSGGLTLACMVLPLLIRTTEEGLRAVPDEYRQAAAAVGLSRCSSTFKVILPVAVPGLLVGLVLSIGRAMAETAALIFTSGYVDRTPGSLLDSGRALSVHIYDLAMNVPGGDENAYAAALVLVAALLVINQTAAWIAARFMHRELLPL